MSAARRSGTERRPTLDQVARYAGVSRATVSRVVNRASTVDPALREVVEHRVGRGPLSGPSLRPDTPGVHLPGRRPVGPVAGWRKPGLSGLAKSSTLDTLVLVKHT
ncbi:LacI family DNA-binding transcriptional regulator [Serinicoccus sp. CUA-874]|uniref:LacI family DNA-binding transcriptional regulator n=1 Tax=Serinicoccus sp. CUA-874 TaxID=1517939 RepID=UPI0009F94784|nr:LacI family DNA-binding transcriptional regulator [Serinicoccus sp. CUA-874]